MSASEGSSERRAPSSSSSLSLAIKRSKAEMISCSTDKAPRSPAYNFWAVIPTFAPPGCSTEPPSGSESPARISSRVVLPAPLRPTSPTFSPASTERVAPERTFRSPPWYFTRSLATITFMTMKFPSRRNPSRLRLARTKRRLPDELPYRSFYTRGGVLVILVRQSLRAQNRRTSLASSLYRALVWEFLSTTLGMLDANVGSVAGGTGRRLPTARRPDVVIEPEDVVGVVLLLDGSQSPIGAFAVSPADPIFLIVTIEEVDVGTGLVRFQSCEVSTCPVGLLVADHLVRKPHAVDVDIVGRATVRVGGGV